MSTETLLTADQERPDEALERFERRTAWPMLVLALAIIPLLVIPITTDLSAAQLHTFQTLDWIIWAAFAAEYTIRFYLAPQRARFFRRNLLDLAVVLLPFLRPIRIARSARVLRLMRLGWAVTLLGKVGKTARNVLTRHGLHFALLTAVLAILGGGAIEWAFERTAIHTSINTLGDGIWWAVSTVATVGYGDKYPVTPEGKSVAMLLMMVGIGVFGIFAASLASFFIEQRSESNASAGESEIAGGIAELNARLARIERVLALPVAQREQTSNVSARTTGPLPNEAGREMR